MNLQDLFARLKNLLITSTSPRLLADELFQLLNPSLRTELPFEYTTTTKYKNHLKPVLKVNFPSLKTSPFA